MKIKPNIFYKFCDIPKYERWIHATNKRKQNDSSASHPNFWIKIFSVEALLN